MNERDQGEETFGEEEVVMYARVIGEEREIHYVFEGDEAGPMHEARCVNC